MTELTVEEFAEKYELSKQTVYNNTKYMEYHYDDDRRLILQDSVKNRWQIPVLRKEIVFNTLAKNPPTGMDQCLIDTIYKGYFDHYLLTEKE